MTVVTTDPLLDHLEQTFADSYRKEIDQEENVWRSLPFFVATLALQPAGLAQVQDWAAAVDGPMLVAAAMTLTALMTVKAALIEQYALAVDNNRGVNTRRAKWRTQAGLATLTSVFAVLVLVALVVLTNVHGHAAHPANGTGLRATAGDAGPTAAKPHPATANDRHL